MNRRHFLIASLATAFSSVVPAITYASEGWVDYEPGVIENLLASGKTVFVDYSATWCSTCKAQERVINDLRNSEPAYNGAMIFVRVDWDTYGRKPVTTNRKIPRRSTLLVLRGDQELGRIVAGTSRSDIETLMNLGM